MRMEKKLQSLRTELGKCVERVVRGLENKLARIQLGDKNASAVAIDEAETELAMVRLFARTHADLIGVGKARKAPWTEDEQRVGGFLTGLHEIDALIGDGFKVVDTLRTRLGLPAVTDYTIPNMPAPGFGHGAAHARAMAEAAGYDNGFFPSPEPGAQARKEAPNER